MKKNKPKLTYKKWLQAAALAWLKFATLEDLKHAMRGKEILLVINDAIATKEGQAIATKMLNGNYVPPATEEYAQLARMCVLKCIRKMSARDIRAALKDKGFVKVLRSVGIPVAGKVE